MCCGGVGVDFVVVCDCGSVFVGDDEELSLVLLSLDNIDRSRSIGFCLAAFCLVAIVDVIILVFAWVCIALTGRAFDVMGTRLFPEYAVSVGAIVIFEIIL